MSRGRDAWADWIGGENRAHDRLASDRVAAMQALAKVGTRQEVEPILRGLLEDP